MFDTWMANSRWLRTAQSRAAAMVYRAGISANQTTVAAAILGVLAGLAFGCDRNVPGLIALWISAVFDAIDGTIARDYERATAFGGVLDLASDRVVEAIVLLGIAWHRPALDFAALTVLASWYVNITVFLAVGAALGGDEKLIGYPPGLLERAEALVFFTVLVAVGAAGAWVCYAYAAMEMFTAVQRLDFGRRHLR